jgi:uncharacterized membrane protein YecN with MAPEG domain
MTAKQKNVLIQIIVSVLLIAITVTLSILIFGPHNLYPPKSIQLTLAVMLFIGAWEVIFVLIRARQRFFNKDEIDGAPPKAGSSGDLQNRILNNTTEQVLLAIPVLFATAGLSVPANGILIILLGVFFCVGRLLFWVGYHFMPTMRGFGFVLTCYPTVFLYIYIFVCLFSGLTSL